jgi:pyruvate/2-oxoglutarate dehydrogenase complex dihydrolipoamide dehydrogenase (E3) component
VQQHPDLSPMDDHNRALLGHVHPPDWANPRPATRYNLVVMGAGTAGLVAAAGAAALGAKVALIERHLMGGDCLNVGCVPSKALIRLARAGAGCDFAAVMQTVRQLRARLAPHDSAARFQSLGVDVFFGAASFAGRTAVEVGGQTLRFARACVATGSLPAVPSIPGLDQIAYLTNESVFNLTQLPRRLAVIGAGPIGCELAQAFARLGSEVFLVEAMHGVLPKDDPQAGAIVVRAMERDGVKLLCCGTELRTEKAPCGARLCVDSHGQHYDLEVDHILVATGRTPNVEGLNLAAAGVDHDPRKGVQVDDHLRTTNRRIFAAGDVCSRFQFTHSADAQARIVIRNALFPFIPFKPRVSRLIVPWCTYTSPQVAHVGTGADDADVQTIRIDLSSVDRAVLDGQEDGFLKVHVRKGTDHIVGGTLVAEHAGDMIGYITMAMVQSIGLRQLSNVIQPYPTQAECIRKAADALERTRLTPAARALFARLMQWQR